MHAPGVGSGGPGQRAFFVGYVPTAPGSSAADQGVGLHLQERCFRLAKEKPQVRGLVLRPGLATRGHPKRQAANVHQFIISPIQEHSRKPEEAREKIVALMGDVPRVELFARQSPPGWDVWGNEVESTIPDFWTKCPEVAGPERPANKSQVEISDF